MGAKYQKGDRWELKRAVAEKYAKKLHIGDANLCRAVVIVDVILKNPRKKRVAFEFVSVDGRGVDSVKVLRRRL